MSRTSTSIPSSFQYIFDAALQDYEKKTRKDLRSHPLLHKLEIYHSPASVRTVLQEQFSRFDLPRSGVDDRLPNWLEPTVNVLSAYSAMIEDRDQLVTLRNLAAYPPAAVIFTGIGVLLSVSNTSQISRHFAVFETIGNFFRRLEIYSEVPPTTGMMDIVVHIMIEMLSILATVTKEINQGRTRQFIKRLIGRRDVEDALQRLDRLTLEESMMATSQVLKATRNALAGVSDVVQLMGKDITDKVVAVNDNRNRNQLRHDLRKWLSPPDPSLNYQTARSTYHPGTALWFTESEAFKDWKAHGSLLWIYGKPGSGKTVLSSVAIENIKYSSITESAHLAYFFFDLKDVGKQDARALLSSILDQLSSQSDSFYDILLGLYSAYDRGSHYPSNRALTQCLEDMLRAPGRAPIYLIVDALDEIGVPTLRKGVLEIVEKLIKLNLQNLRLCITSRLEIDILMSLEPLSPKQISIHDQSGQRQDIVDYVTSVIESDENMRRWTEEDKKTVIEILSERADGMFRWVFCQLESLRHCHLSSIRHVLAELPKTLDETYKRILQAIPEANRAHAHRLLQCLAVAVRPLRVEELAEVLALDFDTGRIPKRRGDWRWEDHEEAVLSACSGLIAVVSIHGSRVVQFSHSSVKAFLISNYLAESEVGTASFYHIRLQPAHKIMAQACLGVLLSLDYQTDEKRLRNVPLAEYAVEHFSEHVEFDDVLPLLKSEVDYFLDPNNPHFAAWVWARRKIVSQTHPPPLEAVPLYYLAELGLRGQVEHLIVKDPQDINARGGQYATPLHAALYMGHLDVLRLLLLHHGDVNIRGNQSETLLHLASKLGHPDIVQQLLRLGADVVARDEDGWTPLHHAIRLGHSELIQILIWQGADIQAQADDGRTPLHLSSEDGRLEVIRLLLGHGADVNTSDLNNSTPLHLASQRGNFEIAKLLLELGANVRARNNNSQTPLHRTLEGQRDTLEGDYLDVMQLLLGRGVHVDSQDKDGSTALHLASYTGSLAAVQLLLKYGATIDTQNNNGRTPLHQTLAGGRNPSDEDFGILKLLLGHDANVDFQDNDGLTPLHLASSAGTLDAARLLLEHGANANRRNEKGQTPLHQASEYGHLDFMRLLIEHGVDVDAEDNSGSTPLHLASFPGKLAAARLLIEHGANVHARDNEGQTPLHLALGGGHLTVMKLLLEYGAAMNAQNNNHWTPLHLASHQGKREAARLLLQHDADVLVRNSKGQTALQLAMARGHNDIIQLLGGIAPREQEA